MPQPPLAAAGVPGALTESVDAPTATLAALFGLSGPELTSDERAFFRDARPLGFILFQRNCVDPEQLRRLTDALRSLTGWARTPILIDQEGGRVQRLKPPHWSLFPPPARYGELYREDPARGLRAAWLAGALLAADLRAVGIDVDCAPVLDLAVAGADGVIGDRALGATPEQVAALGTAMIDGFRAGGVIPVIKHLPGHGRALLDSHAALPRLETPLAQLEATDFAAFRAVAQGRFGQQIWGMTGHLLLPEIDPGHSATCSPRVIAEIIRGRIGFDGFLLSDDLSMRALAGSYQERSQLALAAGCDAVLHCNGDRGEMLAVAQGARPLDAAARRRFAAATIAREVAAETSLNARQEFEALLAA